MIDFDINTLPIPLKRQKELRRQLETLEAYKDKTYITAEWLVRNGFMKTSIPTKDYLYCNDAVEICAKLKDKEAGKWKVDIQFLDHGDVQSLDIFTVGQLRMFLAICGLDNIVEQFK